MSSSPRTADRCPTRSRSRGSCSTRRSGAPRGHRPPGSPPSSTSAPCRGSCAGDGRDGGPTLGVVVTTDGRSRVRLPDGRRLDVWQGGDPRGLPLVFFHGTPGGRLQAALGDGAAARAGVRLVAFSRPGYGGSTDGRTTLSSVGDGRRRGRGRARGRRASPCSASPEEGRIAVATAAVLPAPGARGRGRRRDRAAARARSRRCGRPRGPCGTRRGRRRRRSPSRTRAMTDRAGASRTG